MPQTCRVRVTLVALPNAISSVLGGFNDLLNGFGFLSTHDEAIRNRHPFVTEVVGVGSRIASTAGGMPILANRTIADVEATDIVVLPPILLPTAAWTRGRHPATVQWLRDMHRKGATLTSVCSGVLLLAETGLLDGHEASLHRLYAPTFRDNYPGIRLRPNAPLIRTGPRSEFLICGGSSSWQLLALHLIARHVGATAAAAMTRFHAIPWRQDETNFPGDFCPQRDHGDAVIEHIQAWLDTSYSVAKPVDAMIRRSGLSERTFMRRFRAATGHAPIEYVQLVRIAAARQRLEWSKDSVDDISWQVGYEDAAFFRRLFKRVTCLTPGVYRRRFRAVEDIGLKDRAA